MLNFAPRVRVPVLMLNGEHDLVFPLEKAVKPMFELLGTKEPDKKLVLYPAGHGLLNVFGPQVRGDILAWLDRYLGPVAR